MDWRWGVGEALEGVDIGSGMKRGLKQKVRAEGKSRGEDELGVKKYITVVVVRE